MDHERLHALATEFLEAWTSQDVDRVLACYTPDLEYRDPNTRGSVRGHEAMSRYLQKLFGAWTMTWSLREAHGHTGGQSATVLWHATFRRASGGPILEADGMDLVELEGDRIRRNVVEFDRSVLGRVAGLDAEALKQLLLRGWMTHDAMWWKCAYESLGIEAANRLNRQAIAAMAPVEVKRVLGALGMRGVSGFADLEAFMTGAMALLGGDFMRYAWQWRPPDTLQVEVLDCFAYRGIGRLGALQGYECGIFDRIYGWLDALGVGYRGSPAAQHCTQHHDGSCVRELRFTFQTA